MSETKLSRSGDSALALSTEAEKQLRKLGYKWRHHKLSHRAQPHKWQKGRRRFA